MFTRPQSTTIDCPTCGTVHEVEIEYDGCDGRAELETWPCQGDDSCRNRCCEGCRVVCFACDCTACPDHSEKIGKHHYCALCAPKFRAEQGATGDQLAPHVVSATSTAGVRSSIPHDLRLS